MLPLLESLREARKVNLEIPSIQRSKAHEVQLIAQRLDPLEFVDFELQSISNLFLDKIQMNATLKMYVELLIRLSEQYYTLKIISSLAAKYDKLKVLEMQQEIKKQTENSGALLGTKLLSNMYTSVQIELNHRKKELERYTTYLTKCSSCITANIHTLKKYLSDLLIYKEYLFSLQKRSNNDLIYLKDTLSLVQTKKDDINLVNLQQDSIYTAILTKINSPFSINQIYNSDNLPHLVQKYINSHNNLQVITQRKAKALYLKEKFGVIVHELGMALPIIPRYKSMDIVALDKEEHKLNELVIKLKTLENDKMK